LATSSAPADDSRKNNIPGEDAFPETDAAGTAALLLANVAGFAGQYLP
jgi:hypothetical protein